MKVSEVIGTLNGILEKYGDIQVEKVNFDDMDGTIYEDVEVDVEEKNDVKVVVI